jgi:hypothetical protein
MSSELPAAQPHPDTVLETNSQEQPESRTQIDPKNRQEDIVPQPSAAEILDNIRLQYFEALYLSKVSEHFAKYTTIIKRSFRHPLHILQKAPYRELVQPSIWTMTRP